MTERVLDWANVQLYSIPPIEVDTKLYIAPLYLYAENEGSYSALTHKCLNSNTHKLTFQYYPPNQFGMNDIVLGEIHNTEKIKARFDSGLDLTMDKANEDQGSMTSFAGSEPTSELTTCPEPISPAPEPVLEERIHDPEPIAGEFMGKPVNGKKSWKMVELLAFARERNIHVPSAIRKKDVIIEFLRMRI